MIKNKLLSTLIIFALLLPFLVYNTHVQGEPVSGSVQSIGMMDEDVDAKVGSFGARNDSEYMSYLPLVLMPVIPFEYTIDPTITPSIPSLPGLNGGPERPVAVIIGPDGTKDEFVIDEVIFHPSNTDQLNSFLSKYDGVILRDGRPLILEGVEIPPELPASTGWYLIRVNLHKSVLADFSANMNAAGLGGHAIFSSEEGARLAALIAREIGQEVTPNFIAQLAQLGIEEHPTTGGGYLNPEDWWWFTEDDNPFVPGDQGLSTGVIHAWNYLQYQGYPPLGTPFYPVTLAIIDTGFDLDPITGLPMNGNLDYFYKGSEPNQIDVVDGDSTAGGPGSGFSNCSGCWHGQMVFGAALAKAGNRYGSAGTAGAGEAYPLLIKVTGDFAVIAQGVWSAIYNQAGVINMSIAGECNWWCRQTGGYKSLKDAIYSAKAIKKIVVAAAGNNGIDITKKNIIPCSLNGAICVGAITSSGQAADFSNWGSVVDIFAPTCFRSTITRDSAAQDADDLDEDELHYFCGTSASSPFVAGVVALMKMLNKDLTYDQVRNILWNTANPSTDPKIAPVGYIDAYRALVAVKPNQAPTVEITSPTNGETISYADLEIFAKVHDPETPSIFGFVKSYTTPNFDTRVDFSIDSSSPICSESGDATGGSGRYFSCEVATLSVGTHTIKVTATDPFGAKSSASVNVNVINHPPQVGISYPNQHSGYTFLTNQDINFQGWVHDEDEIIQDVNTGWYFMFHDPGSQFWAWSPFGSGKNIWKSFSTPGVYSIRFKATDLKGATASDDIEIIIQDGAGIPIVTITQPLNGDIFGPNVDITFIGSAFDPDYGELTGMQLIWTSNHDGFLGFGTNITSKLSSLGESTMHIITLTASAPDGDSNSAIIVIYILSPG